MDGFCKTEIAPETRLMLIELAEGFAEGVRNGTFKFSEEGGRKLAGFLRGIVNPEMEGVDPESGMKTYSITRASGVLGISQPTFRKYVREGIIPKGIRIADIPGPRWNKEEIEEVRKKYFSGNRKVIKN